MDAILEVENIVRDYGATRAVDGVSLSLRPGRVHALIGESGSGKTTLARILGGLDRKYSGEIHMQKGARAVLVQQDFVVWPKLSAEENIAIGCRNKNDQRELVPEIIDLFELTGMAAKRAGELSYGQQQRVAIGRALANRPDVILLDEPFAHLDVWLRSRMWERCVDIFRKMEVTSLWITHIVQDAFPVAEEVFAMDRGRIVQTGSPEAIYCQPAHESVARISGIFSSFTKETWRHLSLDAQAPFPKGAKRIGLRPECLHLVEDAEGRIDGGALSRHFFGASSVYSLRITDLERVWVCSHTPVRSGTRYAVGLQGEPFVLE